MIANMIIIYSILGCCLVIIQIFLSLRKNRYLGMILPTVSLIVSLVVSYIII